MRQLKITQQITNRETHSLNKYFTEISGIPMVSAEEETDLAKRIKEGDMEALEKLVKSNLRFVVSVAKQYQSTGDLLDDLISAGNIGLIEAAKRFDETKGFKFISYAVWWIRQSIVQYVSENNKMIRVPSNKIQINTKLKNISTELEQVLERRPNVTEIADAYIEKYNSPINEDSVYDILYCNVSPFSMDAKVSNDEDSGSMHDLLPGEGFKQITNILSKEDLNRTIMRVANKLSNTEKIVLLSYYGINCEEKSLSEIGEDLDLTRERVRQIKEKALRKFKMHTPKKLLKEYI